MYLIKDWGYLATTCNCNDQHFNSRNLTQVSADWVLRLVIY